MSKQSTFAHTQALEPGSSNYPDVEGREQVFLLNFLLCIIVLIVIVLFNGEDQRGMCPEIRK